MTESATKNKSKKVNKGKNYFFLQGLLVQSFKNRLWITVVTLVTFLAILVGIGHSLIVKTELHQEWKEILLLVLGAFIGSYNRVIDFWFNSNERDREMMARADQEDDSTGQAFQDSSNSISEDLPTEFSEPFSHTEFHDENNNPDSPQDYKGIVRIEGHLKLK